MTLLPWLSRGLGALGTISIVGSSKGIESLCDAASAWFWRLDKPLTRRSELEWPGKRVVVCRDCILDVGKYTYTVLVLDLKAEKARSRDRREEYEQEGGVRTGGRS